MSIDYMLSIGFPLIILVAATIYLFHGVRANLQGQFTKKAFRITKLENPSKFRWIVWGRISTGIILLIVSIAFAYVFHHS